MGLDQYAYAAAKANAKDEYYEERYERGNTDAVNPTTELAYWRKHPNLQGWMERLWIEKEQIDPNGNRTFNGVELELTWDDLDRLEQDVRAGNLPATSGFLFGENSDEYYKDTDLEFIRKARIEIFMGLRVFYDSSW